MHHVLDNAAWNALTSGNKALASGEGSIRFFNPNTSPFIGLETPDEENFALFRSATPDDAYYLLLTPHEHKIPADWRLINHTPGRQMVYEGASIPFTPKSELITLADKHIPQMLALTKLTNPGPFAERTIDFGHYRGIFEGDQLVAM